jgi:hypothetical protein
VKVPEKVFRSFGTPECPNADRPCTRFPGVARLSMPPGDFRLFLPRRTSDLCDCREKSVLAFLQANAPKARCHADALLFGRLCHRLVFSCSSVCNCFALFTIAIPRIRNYSASSSARCGVRSGTSPFGKRHGRCSWNGSEKSFPSVSSCSSR